MNKIDLKEIIGERYNNYFSNLPKLLSKFYIFILEKLLHVSEFNVFISLNHDKKNFELIDEFLEYLDFSYYLSSNDKPKIPSEGKLICVANHPLGGLDALSVIKAVGEVRRDVKLVANDLLINVEQLQEILLPYNIFSAKIQKKQIENIESALLNEEAVIIFPAGEVSRMTLKGIQDSKWQKGAVRLASKLNAPILPICVKGKNSILFYIMSIIYKKFSMFLLAHEIFHKSSKTITLKIGDPIPASVFKSDVINIQEQIKLLKKHVYNIGKGKPGILKTEKTIIHPTNYKKIKTEFQLAPVLYDANDGKKVFLIDYEIGPNIVNEISRLREVTFRKVGEGTGRKSDIDKFDKYYKHIVLWDEEALEIIGSYRVGISKKIIDRHGTGGLYNSEQFYFTDEFKTILEKSFEMGRSFIQQKYWKTNALDCLWKGIGKVLDYYPDTKYLFGAVSISNSYSEIAKNLIVQYYKKWYQFGNSYAYAKNKLITSSSQLNEINLILNGDDHISDFKILKKTLKIYGYSVPVILRNYMDLVEYGGCNILEFGVDEGFANSIDVLILIDLEMLTPAKQDRYLGNNRNMLQEVEEYVN